MKHLCRKELEELITEIIDSYVLVSLLTDLHRAVRINPSHIFKMFTSAWKQLPQPAYSHDYNQNPKGTGRCNAPELRPRFLNQPPVQIVKHAQVSHAPKLQHKIMITFPTQGVTLPAIVSLLLRLFCSPPLGPSSTALCTR